MLTAEGDNLGIEDQIAGRVRFSDSFKRELFVVGTRLQDRQAWRGRQTLDRLTGLVGCIRGSEQPRVGDDADEPAKAEQRNYPARPGFSERYRSE